MRPAHSDEHAGAFVGSATALGPRARSLQRSSMGQCGKSTGSWGLGVLSASVVAAVLRDADRGVVRARMESPHRDVISFACVVD